MLPASFAWSLHKYYHITPVLCHPHWLQMSHNLYNFTCYFEVLQGLCPSYLQNLVSCHYNNTYSLCCSNASLGWGPLLARHSPLLEIAHFRCMLLQNYGMNSSDSFETLPLLRLLKSPWKVTFSRLLLIGCADCIFNIMPCLYDPLSAVPLYDLYHIHFTSERGSLGFNRRISLFIFWFIGTVWLIFF